jgi:hypothetical protein
MKKVIIYFSLIVFAIGGCKKVDLDEGPSGYPVFIVDATLDGVNLNLVAGDDDFYMFSEFSKDNSEVYTMTGRFAKDANCDSECDKSLSFSIRSSYVTPSVIDFNFENAILLNDPLLYFSLDDIVEVNGFTYLFTGELVDSFGIPPFFYTWDIIEVDSLIIPYIGESISHTYFGSEDLSVRLKVSTAFGCESYFETIVPNGNNAPSFCNLDISVDYDSLGNLLLSPIFGNPSMDTFIWNNDSTISTPFSINPNSFPNVATLEAFNANCNVEMGICTIDPGALTAAFPQFQVVVQDTTKTEMISVGEQLSAVTIEYQDSTGTYSSKFIENSNSTFTITKIENYEDNENGEKTKRLTIDYLNCILKKEGSGELKSISGTAEIAVAYPD